MTCFVVDAFHSLGLSILEFGGICRQNPRHPATAPRTRHARCNIASPSREPMPQLKQSPGECAQQAPECA